LRARATIVILFAIGALLLAGCGQSAMAFSPQQAAIRAVTLQHGPNIVVDQNTIQIRQTVQMDKVTFVALSYRQTDDGKKSDCTMVYGIEQKALAAWAPIGGGGGCTFTEGDQAPPAEPVEFGSGTNGGSNPADPGFSYAYGLVNQDSVVKVRVIWADGQQQEVSVVNSSYLAVRAGEVHAEKVEGLNVNGDLVYGNDPAPAPGKW